MIERGLPWPDLKIVGLMYLLGIPAMKFTKKVRKAHSCPRSWCAMANIGHKGIYLDPKDMKNFNKKEINWTYLHEICHCLDSVDYGFRKVTKNNGFGVFLRECIATHGAEILSRVLKIKIDREGGRHLLNKQYKIYKEQLQG